MIPDGLGYGEVEEDHALGGLAGTDHRVAEQGLGCQGLQVRKSGVDVGKIALFDCAGGNLFAFGSGKGGGEILQEEREIEAVVDAQSREDIKVVLGVLVADDDGVGLKDGVNGIHGGMGDGKVGGSVRGEAEKQSENDTENEECQKYRREQVASVGLCKLELSHWQ